MIYSDPKQNKTRKGTDNNMAHPFDVENTMQLPF
jgi:hypothetical protein